MSTYFFLKGILLGLLVAMPVGPVAILCIQRTLQHGRASGFFSGLGAAVADTFYGIIAAFGLTWVSHFLSEEQFWVRLAGGTFLFCLGIKIFYARPIERSSVSHETLRDDFISTFALTITNPMTIISYVAVFAALGISDLQGHYSYGGFLILGVFLGATGWWLILSEGITLFRKKITKKVMRSINRIAGVVIGIFGVIVWITLLV